MVITVDPPEGIELAAKDLAMPMCPTERLSLAAAPVPPFVELTGPVLFR
jgi:hypothetical protein